MTQPPQDDDQDLGLDSLTTIPVQPADEPQPHQDARGRPSRKAHAPQIDVSEIELRFLKAVLDNPGLRSGDYPQVVGMSSRRVQTLRKHLVERGYIREHAVATGQRGRDAILIEPLDSAKTAVAATDQVNAQARSNP